MLYTARIGAPLLGMKTPLTPSARSRTIPLLVLGAIGALLFTCTAAAIFYKNTQRLFTSHELEGHSQEVLNLLELTARQMERADYLSRIYLTTKIKTI